MPELPEVQTVVNALNRKSSAFPWRVIATTHEGERWNGFANVDEINSITRRGKYIVFHVNDKAAVLVHLGMSGVLSLKSVPPTTQVKHLRSFLQVQDQNKNVFYISLQDPRGFGGIWYSDDYVKHPRIAKLGLEPLDASFSTNVFYKNLRNTSRGIKSVLLAGDVVTGVGNIYADEVLFAARIHPLVPANTLEYDQVDELRTAIVRILSTSIANSGTTFASYRTVDGSKGNNQDNLLVYARAGLQCVRCGCKLSKIKVAARSTVFCSQCQKPTP